MASSLHNEEEDSICFPAKVEKSMLPSRISLLVLAVSGITAPRAVCLKLSWEVKRTAHVGKWSTRGKKRKEAITQAQRKQRGNNDLHKGRLSIV